MSNAANELRRLRYLSAMGIPSLVSRRALPGAAPSRKLAVKAPQEKALNAPPVKGEIARPASSGAPKALRQILDSAPSAEPAQTVTEVPTPVREQSRVEEVSVRFRLAVLVCAKRLWVEDLGDGALARDQIALIGAMGRAMEHPADGDGPKVTQFDWPIHGNKQLSLGKDEAAASLQGFLTRQLDDNACIEMICLGDAAWTRLRGLSLPCASRSVAATRDMLATPLLKKDVWSELRPR